MAERDLAFGAGPNALERVLEIPGKKGKKNKKENKKHGKSVGRFTQIHSTLRKKSRREFDPGLNASLSPLVDQNRFRRRPETGSPRPRSASGR